MPTIYRVKIEGDEDIDDVNLPEGVAGVALFNDDQGSLVSQYTALRKNEEWIPIRHPIEESDLTNAGETYESASRKGILWTMTPIVCLDCGEISYKPNLRYKIPYGCLIQILIGLASAVFVYFYFSTKILLAVLIGFQVIITLLLPMIFLGNFIGRVKFADRVKKMDITECATCSSCNFKSVTSLIDKSVSLKNGRKLTVTIGGRS